MKRLLLSAIVIAVITGGCGSGGSTTSAATRPTVTKPVKRHKPHKAHKAHKAKRKTRHHTPHRVSTSSSGGASAAPPVTTTTAPAVVTTTPPPATTTTATPPPPPTTTQQQTTTQHHTGTTTTSQGYCLSVTARIGTPGGSIPVAQITPGMFVWSTDLRGQRIRVKVVRVHHTHVPSSHMMVRLRLADGRALLVSLGHPLPDGQPIRTLAVGQRFEGTRVTSNTRVRYGRPYTYDLLPAGPTHTYFADGVLLGSTLAPNVALTRPF